MGCYFHADDDFLAISSSISRSSRREPSLTASGSELLQSASFSSTPYTTAKTWSKNFGSRGATSRRV
jgi:hypothetical protein